MLALAEAAIKQGYAVRAEGGGSTEGSGSAKLVNTNAPPADPRKQTHIHWPAHTHAKPTTRASLRAVSHLLSCEDERSAFGFYATRAVVMRLFFFLPFFPASRLVGLITSLAAVSPTPSSATHPCSANRCRHRLHSKQGTRERRAGHGGFVGREAERGVSHSHRQDLAQTRGVGELARRDAAASKIVIG